MFTTIGDFHRYVRESVFHRASATMCEFEKHHPEIMNLPLSPDNLQQLADAEDKFVQQNISITNPGTMGNLAARAWPSRTLAVGLVSHLYGGTAHGVAGATNPNYAFQSDAQDYYHHGPMSNFN